MRTTPLRVPSLGLVALGLLIGLVLLGCRRKEQACKELHRRIDAVDAIHRERDAEDPLQKNANALLNLAKRLRLEAQEIAAVRVDDADLRGARDLYGSEVAGEAACYESAVGDPASARLANFVIPPVCVPKGAVEIIRKCGAEY